jgi:hypothetical protein
MESEIKIFRSDTTSAAWIHTEWIWGNEQLKVLDDRYTVKSYSKLIDKAEYPDTFTFTKLLWKELTPPNIEIFLWLLL